LVNVDSHTLHEAELKLSRLSEKKLISTIAKLMWEMILIVLQDGKEEEAVGYFKVLRIASFMIGR
jgi:hypothetical protein